MNRVKPHKVRAQRVVHLGRITAADIRTADDKEDGYGSALVRNEVGRWMIIPTERIEE